MSDEKSGLKMVCGICYGDASRDGHGNIWHTDGRSDVCDILQSVPHYRFVAPENLTALRAESEGWDYSKWLERASAALAAPSGVKPKEKV